jgi:hypothetical protein
VIYLTTFPLEIVANGRKLCLPLRLEPIGFRLTWEMICAAKNDEKEMFEKLVKNATEAKNIPDNFIGSIIDDENHSLLLLPFLLFLHSIC